MFSRAVVHVILPYPIRDALSTDEYRILDPCIDDYVALLAPHKPHLWMSMIFLEHYKTTTFSLLNGQYITCAMYPCSMRLERNIRLDPFWPNAFGNIWNTDVPAVKGVRPTKCQPLTVKMRTRTVLRREDRMICVLVCPVDMNPSSNIDVIVLNLHLISSPAVDDWTCLRIWNFY